jgi:hypothetical protein
MIIPQNDGNPSIWQENSPWGKWVATQIFRKIKQHVYLIEHFSFEISTEKNILVNIIK